MQGRIGDTLILGGAMLFQALAAPTTIVGAVVGD